MAWECGHTVEADLHGHVHFSGGWIYILLTKYMEKRILWQALFHGTPTVSGRGMNPIGGYFRGITPKAALTTVARAVAVSIGLVTKGG